MIKILYENNDHTSLIVCPIVFYKSTVLIISHDRALLNRAVSGILHLSHNKLNYYSGNYDRFDAERRMKLEQQLSMKNKQDKTDDSKNNKISKDCPNMLIEKDGKFVLFNSNKDKVPGINPIYFNDLDEYIKYIDFFNKEKSKCPILIVK